MQGAKLSQLFNSIPRQKDFVMVTWKNTVDFSNVFGWSTCQACGSKFWMNSLYTMPCTWALTYTCTHAVRFPIEEMGADTLRIHKIPPSFLESTVCVLENKNHEWKSHQREWEWSRRIWPSTQSVTSSKPKSSNSNQAHACIICVPIKSSMLYPHSWQELSRVPVSLALSLSSPFI